MTIGLKDLNKKKDKKARLETVTEESLLDLILIKHEKKFIEKNQKKKLRPWESHEELESMAQDGDKDSKKREEAIIEMERKIKKRASQLFSK